MLMLMQMQLMQDCCHSFLVRIVGGFCLVHSGNLKVQLVSGLNEGCDTKYYDDAIVRLSMLLYDVVYVLVCVFCRIGIIFC